MVAIFVSLGALTAFTQDPPASKPVRISFLPPPLEGTISLGIYDSAGRLLRVLHREAEVEDFAVEADALGTIWDGKNDAGEPQPPGKYRARGYAVGDVVVDGVGFFFNDWVTDEDSPHVRRISRLWVEDGTLLIAAAVGEKEEVSLACDSNGKITGEYPSIAQKHVTDRDEGRDDTVWLLGRGDDGVEIQQTSASEGLIRRMKIQPDEPQPVGIAASQKGDRIFLLEESSGVQRVRALILVASKQEGEKAISDWKVEFEKKIVKHDGFAIADGKPVLTGGTASADKVEVRLQPNPLKKDARETLALTVGYDAEGSYLKTSDGLPLQSISETRNLRRVVLSPQSANAVDVFQDDEAVVEQFRITNLDRMLSFDCGEIELK